MQVSLDGDIRLVKLLGLLDGSDAADLLVWWGVLQLLIYVPIYLLS